MKCVHYSKRMQTGLRKFCGRSAWQIFLKAHAGFSDVVRVKKKIKISPSHCPRFQLATSPIGMNWSLVYFAHGIKDFW